MLGDLSSSAQPGVCPPMHPAGFIGKFVEETNAAAQSLPHLLRLAKRTITRTLLLARVGELVAMPTREQLAATIELGDPPPAIEWACEPRTSAAKVAACPCDRDALPNVLPLDCAVTGHAIDEHQSVMLALDPDAANRLAVP